MAYALLFALLSGYLVVVAIAVGSWGWLLFWPAFSLAIFSCAYAGAGPRLLGKRRDGRLAWWAWLLLLPLLAVLWIIWHLQRLLSREPTCHEIAPGIWLGRRAFLRELPAGVVLVIDLTAELPAPAGVARHTEYIALPTLDATGPGEQAMREVLERIRNCSGPVYLHCAVGHGRSATLAAAVLLMRGLASDVRQAEQQLKQIRPGVRLNAAQKRALRRLG